MFDLHCILFERVFQLYRRVGKCLIEDRKQAIETWISQVEKVARRDRMRKETDGNGALWRLRYC